MKAFNFLHFKRNKQYTISFFFICVIAQSLIAQDVDVVSTNIQSDTTINVNTANIVDDSMKKPLILEEVFVSVGYGIQKKSNVSGAISKVQFKELENRVLLNVNDALKGATSGLLVSANSGAPGAGSRVVVRGVASINNSDPLYVVDGVPVSGGIDYLNNSDIESVEVLKDAASAAIYGTKAASGVILITTRKGKKGDMKVNFNMYLGLQQSDTKLKLLNATQYATLRNESLVNAGKAIAFADPASLGVGTDWQNQVFNEAAPIKNYELNISGGSDKSTYFASFGYYDQDGIISSNISNYKRFSGRFNSNHEVKKWLKFGNNLAYTYNKSLDGVDPNNYFGQSLSSAIGYDPTTPITETDPIQLADIRYNNNLKYLMTNNDGHIYGLSQFNLGELSNPLAYEKTVYGNYSYTHKIVGNAFIEIEPIKNLKIRSNYGIDMAFYGKEAFKPLYYLSSQTQNIASNSFNREAKRAIGYIITNTIAYSGTIAQDHHFNALGGMEYRVIPIEILAGVTYSGIPATTFAQASMNYSISANSRVGYGSEGQDYFINSYFGRLGYDYKEKYIFTGVLRADGSSHFGANNQYGFFPSFSLAWVANKENFWIENKVLNTAKFRFSYGINGNDNLSAFQYVSNIAPLQGYAFGTSNIFVTGNGPKSPANPDLKWERTSQLNAGVDLTFFQRLNVTIDYFHKNTSDMLLQPVIPGYIGASDNPYANVAGMINKGVEIEVSYKNKYRKFRYEIKGNFSYINNEVTNIGTFQFIEGSKLQSSSYNISRTVVGQPIASFYGFEHQGVFQNQAEIDNYIHIDVNGFASKIQPNAKPGDFKWADRNNNGRIEDSDRTFLGSPIPKMMFAFTLNLNYGSFDFTLNAQGVAGNKVYQAIRRLDITSANYTSKYWNRWTGEGTSNDIPRLTDVDDNRNLSNPSNFYLEDGSFLRIRTISLGYTIPNILVSKLHIDKCRVYVSINNLYTFTNYSGYNPEIGGSNTDFGIDKGVYPSARAYLIGVNLTF